MANIHEIAGQYAPTATIDPGREFVVGALDHRASEMFRRVGPAVVVEPEETDPSKVPMSDLLTVNWREYSVDPEMEDTAGHEIFHTFTAYALNVDTHTTVEPHGNALGRTILRGYVSLDKFVLIALASLNDPPGGISRGTGNDRYQAQVANLLLGNGLNAPVWHQVLEAKSIVDRILPTTAHFLVAKRMLAVMKQLPGHRIPDFIDRVYYEVDKNTEAPEFKRLDWKDDTTPLARIVKHTYIMTMPDYYRITYLDGENNPVGEKILVCRHCLQVITQKDTHICKPIETGLPTDRHQLPKSSVYIDSDNPKGFEDVVSALNVQEHEDKPISRLGITALSEPENDQRHPRERGISLAA